MKVKLYGIENARIKRYPKIKYNSDCFFEKFPSTVVDVSNEKGRNKCIYKVYTYM